MPVGMLRVAVGHELAFTRTESSVVAVRFATGNAGLQRNQSGLGGPFPALPLADRAADSAFSIHTNVVPAYFTGRIIQGASDTVVPSLTCRSANTFCSARRRRVDEPVENGQPVGDGFRRPGGQRIPLPRLQTPFGSPRPAGSVGLAMRPSLPLWQVIVL